MSPLMLGASGLINGRITLERIAVERGDVEVALWGKNLTDNNSPRWLVAIAGLFASSSFLLGSDLWN